MLLTMQILLLWKPVYDPMQQEIRLASSEGKIILG